MATTTNYNWSTPDDTALVKDGAAAIRTLGSSVDTTVKNLNPETTLGDISYRSSTANTNTRLALGTAGQVLRVNSGATAPEWATASSGGMTLLSTTTLSGASTTISAINQTYNNLQILIFGMTNATADGIFKVKPNGASNLTYQAIKNDNTLQRDVNSDRLQDDVINQADNTVQYLIDIYDYANTTRFKPIYFCGITPRPVSTRALFGGGSIQTNSAITSIEFSNTGGNFSSGTVLIYGVK